MVQIELNRPVSRACRPGQYTVPVKTRRERTIFCSVKNETTFPVVNRLQELLCLVLETEPSVLIFEPLADGSINVRYRGGRALAVPLPARGTARVDALRLKDSATRAGRRMVLVPEHRLTSPTDRDNRRMVAECGDAILRPTERTIVVDALLEVGGQCELGDVASLLTESEDPVAAVLSLVPRGILKVDMTRPIDGRSTVAIFDPLVHRS